MSNKRNPGKPQTKQNQPTITISNDGQSTQKSELIFAQRTYQGPLPPAGELVAYNNAVPDAAERILKMAEAEQQHRHANEDKVIDESIKLDKRTQWMAFVLALLAFTVAGGAMYFGYPWVASLAIGATLTNVLSNWFKEKGNKEGKKAKK